MQIQITREEFKLFQKYVYDHVGISLADHKITLVQGRLSKRLRQLSLQSYREYYDYLAHDPTDKELFFFVDAISTNVTSFFREPSQWAFLEENIDSLLAAKKNNTLRIWSAACSSGEEPYSIIMFLKEHFKQRNLDIKILATDISQDILKKAMDGTYKDKAVENLPSHILNRYFTKYKSTETGRISYQIDSELKKDVLFRMFNLIYDDFGIFRNKFDIIFCRNVMIYFDAPSQDKLISNFAKLLDKGSWLFVGHSEALTRNKDDYKLMGSSIYQRI